MENRDYKFVDISDSVAIPVPKGLTTQEEAAFLAEYLGQSKLSELAELEAIYRELLEQLKEGTLISFENVLHELGVFEANPEQRCPLPLPSIHLPRYSKN